MLLDEWNKLEWTQFDGIGEENREGLPKGNRGRKRKATWQAEHEQMTKKVVKYQLRSRSKHDKCTKLIVR